MSEKNLDIKVVNNERLMECLKDLDHTVLLEQVNGLVKKLQEDVDALAGPLGLKLKTTVLFEFE
jgi:hypothetical protein